MTEAGADMTDIAPLIALGPTISLKLEGFDDLL
jgi:hypothetical protein